MPPVFPPIPSGADSSSAPATDTAALQQILDGGGGQLAARSYLASERLRVKSRTFLRGAGPQTIITQDPAVDLFITLTNDDMDSGNDDITIEDLTLDGARPNTRTPRPWAAYRPQAEGDCIYDSTVEGKIYVCAVGGVTGASVPTGTGTGISDGTVEWDYVCPLWAQTEGFPLQQSSLAYFSRCRNLHFRRVIFRNSRANGLIVEGSADADFVFGPSLVPIGSFGSQVVTAWIVARDSDGNAIAISVGTRITDAPDVLDVSHFVRIEWSAVLGGATYDVLIGDTRHKLDSTTGLHYDYTGGSTTAYAPPGPALISTGAGNLSAQVTLEDCVFERCNKGGLYTSSAERIAGAELHFDDCWENFAPACTWWSSFSGITSRRSVQGSGLTPGRDTRHCYFEGNFDGINTTVGEISSPPLELHGRMYPTVFALTSVTPAAPAATARTYMVASKDVRGRVVSFSTLASGQISDGNASPDDVIDWPAQTDFGAVNYDVLLLVGNAFELIANTALLTYHYTGAATSAYDNTALVFHYGISDCIIEGTVTYGSVVLRKSYDCELNLTVLRPGISQDVSSPHGIDLQGSPRTTVRARVTDAGDAQVFGTSHAVGVEEYVDPDLGTTIYSVGCAIIDGDFVDTRSPQTMDAVYVKPGNLHCIVARNRTNVHDGVAFTFEEPTTIAYDNATEQADGSVVIDADLVVAPAALPAGDTIQIDPGATWRELELSSSAIAFVCSIAATYEGHRGTLRNVGAYAIALGHAEGAGYGGGAPADLFDCPDARPFVLQPGAAVDVLYRSSRFRVLAAAPPRDPRQLGPLTGIEFNEQTGIEPTRFYLLDLTQATDLAESGGGTTLVKQGTPVLDVRTGGFRGAGVTEGGNGWRADAGSPGAGSALHVGSFAQAADGNFGPGIDALLFGRVDTTAAKRSYLAVDGSNGRLKYFLTSDGITFAIADTAKVVTDSIPRIVVGQRDTDDDEARCRVARRGEAVTQSPDADASGIGNVDGGMTPWNFVGAAGLTGCTATGWIGFYAEVFGAAAAGATTPAKVLHRLGAE